MTSRWILAVLAGVAIAGCNGDDDENPDPDVQTIQGTWRVCADEEVGDDWEEDLTFSGTSFTGVTRQYATTDGTCGGAVTSTDTFTGSFVLGAEVAATIGVGGTAVTARETDVTITGQGTFYTITYVDTAPTPDLLYTGDETVDPARDATTPAKRPNVLQDDKARVKQ